MMSLRTKVLIGFSCIGPVALVTVWSVEFWMLREIQRRNLPPGEAAQFGWNHFGPWLPLLLPAAAIGFVCTIPTLVSLYFDNRSKR